jgi:hypothetical protein
MEERYARPSFALTKPTEGAQRSAPHPIEEIGPDQHAEAAAGIGERRRVPPGIIGVR